VKANEIGGKRRTRGWGYTRGKGRGMKKEAQSRKLGPRRAWENGGLEDELGTAIKKKTVEIGTEGGVLGKNRKLAGKHKGKGRQRNPPDSQRREDSRGRMRVTRGGKVKNGGGCNGTQPREGGGLPASSGRINKTQGAETGGNHG